MTPALLPGGWAERATGPELLNAASVNGRKQAATLRQFAALNILFSRSRHLLKKYVIADMRRRPHRRHTFLDLGAGAGDISRWLAGECRRRRLTVDITCLDNDPRVTAYAERACAGFDNITVVRENALSLDALAQFDYIFSNHFLHHLDAADAPRVLRLLARRTRRVFLANDLARSLPAFLVYTLFAAVFLRNSYHLSDGRLSIRRAFRRHELAALVKESALPVRWYVGKLMLARIYLVGGPGWKA